MRVPLGWLRDYVDVELAPDALAAQLTLRGMEVKGIEVIGADWTDVVVGRVLAVDRHPNADTLWLTRVEVGDGEPLEIVCGADNVRPGQLVPVARVGAVLPGERRIARSRIRGVESNGMLCSPIELGLGEDAEGIHILGTADELPIGADLRPILGEVVLDVDVKPNRGDALSMIGLAREVAAFSGGTLRWPASGVEEDPDLLATDHVSVRVEDPESCPRFTARWFEEVDNGASPAWMQRRLLAAGLRPVSGVVDITNYVMHELGQPMHAYDADALPGGRIVVRRARDGERLTTIDHLDRPLDARMLVIADESRSVGLAGIMGGAETEVTDTTRRVVLESAIFHGPTIRNTARRLGLRSEASARHEKGIAHGLPVIAADRAARLLAEHCSARVARGYADSNPTAPEPRRITVDVARMDRLLGIDVDTGSLPGLLTPLEFEVAAGSSAGQVLVTVPDHRLDVIGPEDVAEEVARAHGYDRIPGRLPTPALPHVRPDPSGLRHRARRILAGLGLDEIVTPALIGPDDLTRSGYQATGEHLVRVANPLAEQHVILRPLIYPSMLRALAENVRLRRSDAWLFEIGKTYHDAGAGALPRSGDETAGTGRSEGWSLGIALMGGEPPADLDDLKGIIEAFHAALGAPAPTFRGEGEEERHRHLHPGRAGRMVDAAGRSYGSVGELHPQVAANWDIPGRAVISAIHLSRLFAMIEADRRVSVPPAAQPVDRDLAVILDSQTPLGELLRLTRTTAGPILVEARLFDTYRGPQIGEDRVSYALALRFQPATAGDERGVERALDKIRGALRHHLGAEIR